VAGEIADKKKPAGKGGLAQGGLMVLIITI
jgi:hypothetical protein